MTAVPIFEYERVDFISGKGDVYYGHFPFDGIRGSDLIGKQVMVDGEPRIIRSAEWMSHDGEPLRSTDKIGLIFRQLND